MFLLQSKPTLIAAITETNVFSWIKSALTERRNARNGYVRFYPLLTKSILLGLPCALVFWYQQIHAPIKYGPGVKVRDEPEQIMLAANAENVMKDGWTLKPLAQYTFKARTLGLKRYQGDAADALAPYDLAVGWGRMSDEAVLERLNISQDKRYYHWRYWGTAPIPESEIINHSANIHLIPADENVAQCIAFLRVGSLVQMSGWLVEATHQGADKPWRSSLTRNDEGNGSCEILYVRSLIVTK